MRSIASLLPLLAVLACGAGGSTGHDGGAGTGGVQSPGSGGGGGASGDAGGSNSGDIPSITWRFDDVLHVATSGSAIRNDTSRLQVAGSDNNGALILVSLLTTTPLTEGTYTCAGSGGVGGATMDYRGAGNLNVTGCVVFLTQLGTAVREWVSGTFQANLADSSGNIKTITDGSFHQPLSAPP